MSRRFRSIDRLCLAVLTSGALLLLAQPAPCQEEPTRSLGFRGWGPRVGFTLSPDQIHGGVQFDLGALADHVRVVPNLEFGMGDHEKLTALNADVFYRFVSRWDAWAPYLGAGPGFFLSSVDLPEGGHHGDTNVGLNLLFGVERGLGRNKFFLEGRIGADNAPDFKAVVGWTFIRPGASAE